MGDFDPDKILNLERRTGVKDDDISAFNSKVDAVNAAIKGMMDGTLDPKDVKIEGIDTDEEKAAKEVGVLSAVLCYGVVWRVWSSPASRSFARLALSGSRVVHCSRVWLVWNRRATESWAHLC
jgi:hypothetical protein